MTAKEFYEMIKKYALDEMMKEGEKAQAGGTECIAHQAASNEAAKFYKFVEMTWIDNADHSI